MEQNLPCLHKLVGHATSIVRGFNTSGKERLVIGSLVQMDKHMSCNFFVFPLFSCYTRFGHSLKRNPSVKTIGLLGGMSWESTVAYYRLINEGVRERFGGLHSAKIVLYSVDFHEIEQLQHQGRWDEAGLFLAEAAKQIESAGADFLVLCTNTMHCVASQIENHIKIPLLHIADATGEEIKKAGLNTVGLLGTRFTMEQDFYRGRLTERYDLKVLIPDERERELIHRVIYEELCAGKVRENSRDQYVTIIRGLLDRGAQGVILGCTEISLLVKAKDVDTKLFDTTAIHAYKSVEWALQDLRHKVQG
jgi:aspartate racemase